MQDPFAKYADYHHASMFAGEFRRDHSGEGDAGLVLAAFAAVLEDMKRLRAGQEPLKSHNQATA
jgi:hypothetical protein